MWLIVCWLGDSLPLREPQLTHSSTPTPSAHQANIKQCYMRTLQLPARTTSQRQTASCAKLTLVTLVFLSGATCSKAEQTAACSHVKGIYYPIWRSCLIPEGGFIFPNLWNMTTPLWCQSLLIAVGLLRPQTTAGAAAWPSTRVWGCLCLCSSSTPVL